MELFRIAKTKYINDLSGAGARTYGGRWNHKGVALVYSSESRALAALEYLVHVPMAMAPTNLSIMQLDIPDGIVPEQLDVSFLPSNWKEYPPPQVLATLGTNWALSNQSLLLRVPSTIVDQEFNFLINPAHPDFKFIKPSRRERFVFDNRLLQGLGA